MRIKTKNTKNKGKKIWKIPLGILAGLAIIVVVYLAYIMISYNRIEDNLPLDSQGKALHEMAKTDTEYTAITYNLGFGAYTQDFTFFMDGGTQSWANSKESVIDCINGDIQLLKAHNPDITLLQEVDIDSTRSYHVNEVSQIRNEFNDYSSTLAINFHSAFLFYPIWQPHGASNSGLLTQSNMQITSGLRRSLPIAETVKKIVDLDRCYSINRINVENGKELVIINAHLSAYGTNGDLQEKQIKMLFTDMSSEYDKGNYVICGGDFNHDFPGNSKEVFNKDLTEEHSWAADFPDEMIPEHFKKISDYESGLITPSCRNCDKPYGPDCYTVIVDGFIVSDNIEVTYNDVIDSQFMFTDHNPVKMKFMLK